jgi:hypothetical protein
LPALIASAEALTRAGADFLTIPCVTAHHFFDGLRAAVRIPSCTSSARRCRRWAGTRRCGVSVSCDERHPAVAHVRSEIRAAGADNPYL